MSVVYNGNSTGVVDHASVSVTNPTDGDALTAASNNAAIQTLANEVQHLKESALLGDVGSPGDIVSGVIRFGGGGNINANVADSIIIAAAGGVNIAPGGSIKAGVAGVIDVQQDNSIVSTATARDRVKMIPATKMLPSVIDTTASIFQYFGFDPTEGPFVNSEASYLGPFTTGFTLPRTAQIQSLHILCQNLNAASRSIEISKFQHIKRTASLVGASISASSTSSTNRLSSIPTTLTWTPAEYSWKQIPLSGLFIVYEGDVMAIQSQFGIAESGLSNLRCYGFRVVYRHTDMLGQDI